jgi:hypothetical protein
MSRFEDLIMLELLKRLLEITCEEERKGPYAAVICILELFLFKGPCLTFEDIQSSYRKGRKGHTKRTLERLVQKGFVKKINDEYCLTTAGLVLIQGDPLHFCPTLFLAGADSALKVASELGIKPLNWLLSAGRYWGNGEFKYSHDFEAARSLGGLLFLDSGAQQFYSKFGNLDYPYSPRQYLDLALKIRADYVATLDLPLDILTPRGLPAADGIKRTVELGVETIALAESMEISGKVVPVLQGFNDASQWLECLDQYKEHGVSPQKFKYWGLGSLCMAKSMKLVEAVIRAVKKALGEGIRIHVFGLSMNSLRRVYGLISSYDTSAWVYWAKMDGAVLLWSSRKKSFIHMQSRDGRRYTTEDLLEANLKNIIEMHNDLCRGIILKMQ